MSTHIINNNAYFTRLFTVEETGRKLGWLDNVVSRLEITLDAGSCHSSEVDEANLSVGLYSLYETLEKFNCFDTSTLCYFSLQIDDIWQCPVLIEPLDAIQEVVKRLGHEALMLETGVIWSRLSDGEVTADPTTFAYTRSSSSDSQQHGQGNVNDSASRAGPSRNRNLPKLTHPATEELAAAQYANTRTVFAQLRDIARRADSAVGGGHLGQNQQVQSWREREGSQALPTQFDRHDWEAWENGTYWNDLAVATPHRRSQLTHANTFEDDEEVEGQEDGEGHAGLEEMSSMRAALPEEGP